MSGLNSKAILFLGLFCLAVSIGLVRPMPTNDSTAETNALNSEKSNSTRHKRSVKITNLFPIGEPPLSFTIPSDTVVRTQVRNWVGSTVRLLCKSKSSNDVMDVISIGDLQAQGFVCPLDELPYTAFACEAMFDQTVLSKTVAKSLSFTLFGNNVGTVSKPNTKIDIFTDGIYLTDYA